MWSHILCIVHVLCIVVSQYSHPTFIAATKATCTLERCPGTSACSAWYFTFALGGLILGQREHMLSTAHFWKVSWAHTECELPIFSSSVYAHKCITRLSMCCTRKFTAPFWVCLLIVLLSIHSSRMSLCKIHCRPLDTKQYCKCTVPCLARANVCPRHVSSQRQAYM